MIKTTKQRPTTALVAGAAVAAATLGLLLITDVIEQDLLVGLMAVLGATVVSAVILETSRHHHTRGRRIERNQAAMRHDLDRIAAQQVELLRLLASADEIHVVPARSRHH